MPTLTETNPYVTLDSNVPDAKFWEESNGALIEEKYPLVIPVFNRAATTLAQETMKKALRLKSRFGVNPAKDPALIDSVALEAVVRLNLVAAMVPGLRPMAEEVQGIVLGDIQWALEQEAREDADDGA